MLLGVVAALRQLVVEVAGDLAHLTLTEGTAARSTYVLRLRELVLVVRLKEEVRSRLVLVFLLKLSVMRRRIWGKVVQEGQDSTATRSTIL